VIVLGPADFVVGFEPEEGGSETCTAIWAVFALSARSRNDSVIVCVPVVENANEQPSGDLDESPGRPARGPAG
jgi:hypothetical protein